MNKKRNLNDIEKETLKNLRKDFNDIKFHREEALLISKKIKEKYNNPEEGTITIIADFGENLFTSFPDQERLHLLILFQKKIINSSFFFCLVMSFMII